MAVSKTADPQALYDNLQTLRFKLTMHTKERKRDLAKIPRYVDLTKEGAANRSEKKKIELEFDSKHESLKDAIDNTKQDISAHEIALRGHALEAYKHGLDLNLTKKMRNGKVRKVVVSWVAKFQQLSLFDSQAQK